MNGEELRKAFEDAAGSSHVTPIVKPASRLESALIIVLTIAGLITAAAALGIIAAFFVWAVTS